MEPTHSVNFGRIGNLAVNTLLVILLYFLFMPTLSLGNGWLYFFILVVCVGLIFAPARPEEAVWTRRAKVCLYFIIPTASLWLLNFILAMDVFNADNYLTAIGKVEESSHFQNEIPEAKPENIVIFDEVVARNIGEKILGTQAALGSQALVGDFHLQNVNGKFYWVAPLLHSGPFKYFANGDVGTPGYVMVSVNDDSDVRLVTEIKGKPLHIIYQMGSHFTRNLQNHLLLEGYLSYQMDTPEFEIDDEGNPYWVVPLSRKRFGTDVMQIDLVLIINPETGAITEHQAANVPAWVDRVYTPEILADQVYWWGEYKHGYFNPAHKDLMEPSGEMVMVYGKGGHCQWYQGMTSKGMDNATVGFILVDSKSKEAKFYNRVGATEISAMTSAEGKVQEKGYFAGHPTAYNIGGEPTYVVPLHDKSNLVKSIAFVNIHDYNHLVVAETLKDALRDYEILMSTKGTGESAPKANIFKGIIRRVGNYTQNNKELKAIWCGNAANMFFVGDPVIHEGLLFAQPGDSIVLEYNAVKGMTIGNIIKVENRSL